MCRLALVATTIVATLGVDRPKLTLIGEQTIRLAVDHHSTQYTDAGAVCTDKKEGYISERVTAVGNVVQTGRPGVYDLKYMCNNTQGVSATPVLRRVIVSENFKPGCTQLVLSGVGATLPQAALVGDYLLQFTRCERNGGKNGGVNQRPGGRCVATSPGGAPLFKKAAETSKSSGGKSAVHITYSSKMKAWVVGAADVAVTTDIHASLRVPAANAGMKPEDVRGPWQRKRSDGQWVDDASIALACKAGAADDTLPSTYNYRVGARLRLAGLTVAQFSGDMRARFVEALADTLDVRNQDIEVIRVAPATSQEYPMGALDYGEANQLLHEGEAFREDTDTDTDSGADSGKAKPKTGRRLQTQMAATKSDADAKAIDVDVEVTNTKEKLMRDVVPQLRETMFSDVFRSELNGQGIPATAVSLQRDSVQSPTMTTRAFIRLLAYVCAAIAIGVLVMTVKTIYGNFHKKTVQLPNGNARLAAKDAAAKDGAEGTAEEKIRLTGPASDQGADAGDGPDKHTVTVGVGSPNADEEKKTAWEQLQIYMAWSMLAASTIGPGSVIVCSDVGASHGLNLIWCLAVASYVAYTLQEASARMCIISGMGLGRAMRYRFGATLGSLPIKVVVAACGVLVGNTAYMCNNFAGALASVGLLHETTPAFTFIMATALASLLLLVLFKADTDEVCKALGIVVVSMTMIFFIAAREIGIEPEAILYGLIPTVPSGSGTLALSVVGTTAIPFNLFLAGAIAEGNSVASMRSGVKLATCVAAVASTMIMVVGTGVKESNGEFSVQELGKTLNETVGHTATLCFTLGLLCAAFSACLGSTLGATVSIGSLKSAASDDVPPGQKAVASAGSDDDDPWGAKSANVRKLMLWCTFAGWVTAVLQLPTVAVVITAQVINGCLLPYLAYCLLVCINDPEIMVNEQQTASQNLNGLLATAVTLFLASTVVITKFFGWAIPHQDHPVVFIAATIMMLVGMDTVIRDVNTARSKETKVRGVLQAHDRLEFIQPPTGDF